MHVKFKTSFINNWFLGDKDNTKFFSESKLDLSSERQEGCFKAREEEERAAGKQVLWGEYRSSEPGSGEGRGAIHSALLCAKHFQIGRFPKH